MKLIDATQMYLIVL